MHLSSTSATPLAWAIVAILASAVKANNPSSPHDDGLLQRYAAMPILPRASAAAVGTTNLQSFQGALGGVQAAAITQSDDTKRPFEVDGDTFTDFQSAANRACDNQHNSCADAANSKKTAGLSVSDCDEQNTQCKSAATSATQTAFTTLTSSNADFDIFCEL